MKTQYFIYSFLAVLLSVICFSFVVQSEKKSIKNTQTVTPIDKNQLIELTKKEDDSLYIINFWAT